MLPSLAMSVIWGCAVCGAADKTLPINGSEVPFDGRRRATFDLKVASFETLDRRLSVREERAQPTLSASLGPSTMMGAEVPVVRRSLAVPGHRSVTAGLGDVDVRVAHTASRRPPGGVARRTSVSAELKLPTAPLERDPAGREVPPDLQPGCGSLVPLVSVSHAWVASLWSLTAGASLLLPVSVRPGAHPGDSLRSSVTLQVQPARALATRLGVHGRVDGTGERDGEVVRRSGGASVHLATELVFSPKTDLVLGVGASFPALQQMRGYRVTSPVLLVSVGLDF